MNAGETSRPRVAGAASYAKEPTAGGPPDRTRGGTVAAPGGDGGPTGRETPPAGADPAWRGGRRQRAAGAYGGPAGWSEKRVARLVVSRIAEPGDAVIGRLLTDLGPAALVRALRNGDALPGLRGARQDRIRARLPGLDPVAELARCRGIGARFICPGDAEWPTQLDDLGDERPFGLWIRGRPSLRHWALRSVSVVGARACTEYGNHVAAELCAELADRGWVVVSGAAYGIDAAAHRGSLAASGPTVAVLACGVDMVYPRRNEALLSRIAHDGLVVAELAPGTNPNRSRFILRNRVIAALTRGTVVVEAGLRSGALVTARRAQLLNRHVMAMPGPITSGLSDGAHHLVRDGAVLVTDAAEVVEQVGAIGADLCREQAAAPLPRDLLDPASTEVLEALPGGPAGGPVESVVAETGRSPFDVLQRLHSLAALGFVERTGAHWRVRRSAVSR